MLVVSSMGFWFRRFALCFAVSLTLVFALVNVF